MFELIKRLFAPIPRCQEHGLVRLDSWSAELVMKDGWSLTYSCPYCFQRDAKSLSAVRMIINGVSYPLVVGIRARLTWDELEHKQLLAEGHGREG